MVGQIAAAPDSLLACGVLFGAEPAVSGAVPMLTEPVPAAAADPAAYAAAWRQVVDFLREHLRPLHKH
jgi:hypothetical protein